jgi:hypothetical protein
MRHSLILRKSRSERPEASSFETLLTQLLRMTMVECEAGRMSISPRILVQVRIAGEDQAVERVASQGGLRFGSFREAPLS